MTSSSDVARCTVHDGAVWIQLDDDVRVKIPSHLSEKSQILMDALSSVKIPSTPSDFSLGVPKEWLQAWVARYGSEDARLSNADGEDLVHCLLVCSVLWNVSLGLLLKRQELQSPA
jgi:hypothetical protein